MRTLLLLLLSVGSLSAADIPQPIPELHLTNGTVFRNVTIVRYEKERVVLKSASGIGPLAYSMINEPLRSRMIAARDEAISSKEKALRDSRIAVAQAEEAERKQAREAEAKENAHRKRVEKAIGARSLIVGMSRDEAEKSWGPPVRKNTSGGAYGSREQWVYPLPEGTTYVYFEAGKLTSWQRSERR